MKIVKRVLAAASLALGLAGCAHEQFHAGGITDYLADRYLFRADTRTMRAFRAYVVQGALIRLATVSPTRASEKNIIVARNTNANDRLSNLMRCAANPDFCYHFDSLMVDYENSLYEMAVSVFDTKQRRSLIGRITNLLTGPIVAGTILETLLDLAREAIHLERPLFGLYRDSIELRWRVSFDPNLCRSPYIMKPPTPDVREPAEIVASVGLTGPIIPRWADGEELALAQKLKEIQQEGTAFEAEPCHFRLVYDMIWHYCGELGLARGEGFDAKTGDKNKGDLENCRTAPNFFTFDQPKLLVNLVEKGDKKSTRTIEGTKIIPIRNGPL